jgi:FixJ family two-component response regulator
MTRRWQAPMHMVGDIRSSCERKAPVETSQNWAVTKQKEAPMCHVRSITKSISTMDKHVVSGGHNKQMHKQMHILRRPKHSVRTNVSTPNNAQSLSDPIILGLNEGHNKLQPFSSISSITRNWAMTRR